MKQKSNILGKFLFAGKATASWGDQYQFDLTETRIWDVYSSLAPRREAEETAFLALSEVKQITFKQLQSSLI